MTLDRQQLILNLEWLRKNKPSTFISWMITNKGFNNPQLLKELNL